MFKPAIDSPHLTILSLLQTEFPLVSEPFAEIGLKLGLSTSEVIRQIQNLKDISLIREISPILDARKLGYENTLVAMRISADHLPTALQVILEHPGISHAYERNHELNVWVTLAISEKIGLEKALKQLSSDTHAEYIYSFPALKVFKLRAIFGQDNENVSVPRNENQTHLVLSTEEKTIVNVIQQDLALVADPFNSMAKQARMDKQQFLAICRNLLQRGVIRRYAASINHRNAGFNANAMVGWIVSTEMVDITGQTMATRPEISHCYVRKTNPQWPYNLFTMIHGQTKEICQSVVDQLALQTGLNTYSVLFSTREFKKIRIKYSI